MLLPEINLPAIIYYFQGEGKFGLCEGEEKIVCLISPPQWLKVPGDSLVVASVGYIMNDYALFDMYVYQMYRVVTSYVFDIVHTLSYNHTHIYIYI